MGKSIPLFVPVHCFFFFIGQWTDARPAKSAALDGKDLFA
jgi:hypothetical protein